MPIWRFAVIISYIPFFDGLNLRFRAAAPCGGIRHTAHERIKEMELRVCPECNKAFYARRVGEIVACPHCGFILYDRRRKKRVRRELAFYLSMEGRVVQATLRDYSKDGLRIAYEGKAPRPDTVLDISIDELDIHRHAQPVWSKKMSKSTVSAGLKLL